jgi:endonuclease YncB( thermonuclease family)
MSSLSSQRRLLPSILAAATLLLAPVRAQSPEPPRGKTSGPRELDEMREQFTLRALAAGRMLADQYSNALASLEAQAAESADYETALAAHQRRLELAEYYANRDMVSGQVIVLKPADAKTIGAVTLDKTDNALTNWRTAGSSAVWDIFKITPGTYTVSLTCGVADSAPASAAAILAGGNIEAQTGGEIEFQEVTNLTGADSARLTAALKSTGGWSSFETLVLGDIKLARTSARFSIRASRLRGTGGLMHLKEIRLTPARPTADRPDREAADAALAELEKVRASHQAKLKELEQPVLDAHLARLAALGDELGAKNDEDGVQAVAAEAKRARRLLEKPDEAGHPAHAGVFPEGMEEVRDAAFLEDPTNTGDRFLITVRGEKISVKLMSVTCPSPNPEDKKARDFHSRYFGITEEDSIMIGRLAQDFTSTYLKDKPLRLLTRWQKDRAGSVLAAVLPAETGDLAGILVDNGLAAVLEPASRNPSQRRIEENTRNVLKHREADAKAKPVPPGAWSLAAETKTTP